MRFLQPDVWFGRQVIRDHNARSQHSVATPGRNTSSLDDVSTDHGTMGLTTFNPSNSSNGLRAANAATLNTTAGAPASLNRNTTGIGYSARIDNSIRYRTPDLAGFTVSVIDGFGENKTATLEASKTVGGYRRYSRGPVSRFPERLFRKPCRIELTLLF
jgi:predicted porin